MFARSSARPLILIAALAAALLAACSPASPALAPTGSPATQVPQTPSAGSGYPAPTLVVPTEGYPAPGAGSPTPPAEGQSREVTLDDNGKTIELAAGERFVLKLGEEYQWTVEVADQSIVSRVVNILTVRGSQGVYEAHQAGQTTLTATGDLPCRSAQPPCAAPSLLFKVDLVVQ